MMKCDTFDCGIQEVKWQGQQGQQNIDGGPPKSSLIYHNPVVNIHYNKNIIIHTPAVS